MMTPAWRYRIQLRSWLAAVPAAGATYSCPRARPQPENDKYRLQYIFRHSRAAPRRRPAGRRRGGRRWGGSRSVPLWVLEILAQHALAELGCEYPHLTPRDTDSAAAPILASEGSASLPAARVGGRARSFSRLDRRSWYHAPRGTNYKIAPPSAATTRSKYQTLYGKSHFLASVRMMTSTAVPTFLSQYNSLGLIIR